MLIESITLAQRDNKELEALISAAAIARRWGCSRQSVNQIKLKALNKLKSQISAHSSSGGGDSK